MTETELLAEVLSEDQNVKPRLAITAPKLEIKVVEATYGWTEDTRVRVAHDRRALSRCRLKSQIRVPLRFRLTVSSSTSLAGEEYIFHAEESPSHSA